MTEPLIKLDSVSRRFGPGNVALDGVDLTVGAGERLAIVGPSGAGKSTLLRVIAGLEQVDSGRVALEGADQSRVPPWKRPIRMMVQEPALVPYWRVDRNVTFGRWPRDGDIELMGHLGLETLARRWPDELSGGQRQRVALARALRGRPKVLLLDEPFGSLEPAWRLELRMMVTSYCESFGIAALLVSHDPAEALGFGHRVLVLIGGRVVQIDSPEAVYSRPATVDAARLLGEPPMNVVPVGTLPTARGAPENAMMVGVRPEDLRRERPDKRGGSVVLEAKVATVELRGEAKLICVECERRLLWALVKDWNGRAGEMITLACEPHQLRYFGADSRLLDSGASKG